MQESLQRSVRPATLWVTSDHVTLFVRTWLPLYCTPLPRLYDFNVLFFLNQCTFLLSLFCLLYNKCTCEYLPFIDKSIIQWIIIDNLNIEVPEWIIGSKSEFVTQAAPGLALLGASLFPTQSSRSNSAFWAPMFFSISWHRQGCWRLPDELFLCTLFGPVFIQSGPPLSTCQPFLLAPPFPSFDGSSFLDFAPSAGCVFQCTHAFLSFEFFFFFIFSFTERWHVV